eukprot:COSAG05_NODE_2275_length_3297_cov_87.259225_6_plen_64_part_00
MAAAKSPAVEAVVAAIFAGTMRSLCTLRMASNQVRKIPCKHHARSAWNPDDDDCFVFAMLYAI